MAGSAQWGLYFDGVQDYGYAVIPSQVDEIRTIEMWVSLQGSNQDTFINKPYVILLTDF